MVPTVTKRSFKENDEYFHSNTRSYEGDNCGNDEIRAFLTFIFEGGDLGENGSVRKGGKGEKRGAQG